MEHSKKPFPSCLDQWEAKLGRVEIVDKRKDNVELVQKSTDSSEKPSKPVEISSYAAKFKAVVRNETKRPLTSALAISPVKANAPVTGASSEKVQSSPSKPPIVQVTL